MSDTDVVFKSLDTIAEDIRDKRQSAVQVTQACLTQIERFLDHNVFIRVLAEDALERARGLDLELARGAVRGPLHGVPIVIKDIIDVAGYPNTAGTGSRRDAEPAAETAPVAKALIDAGAVVVGLANMHEWAYGGTSSNVHYGPVRNMWDRDRMPGGSSGGTAAAVSGGMGYVGLGTDTGGSVRIPASVTGTSALKVTVGAVPTTGVWPLTWTLDTVGPMARTVADLVTPYEVWSRYFSLSRSRQGRPKRIAEAVLGIDRAYYLQQGRMEPGVYDVFNEALERIEAAGARIVDVSLPLLSQASSAQYLLVLAEASAVHSGAWRNHRAEYSDQTQGLLALGDTLTAQDYIAALRFRPALFAQYSAAFAEVDFMISPTTPHAATLIGQETLDWPDGSSESLLDACWRFTFPSNLVGIPSLSQPCGLTTEGLPVGLQLIGPPHSETSLLDLGVRLEQDLDWHFIPPSAR